MINDEKSEKQETIKAVALQYREDENTAPKIVAKGKGKVAENILLTAQNNAVPVYKNKTLTAMLMALEIDKEIPPDLYAMVAEVLAYVYRMDQKRMKDFNL
ncbi:EscU/YscU/HrcU family type III secretion system export apparatus switch protein [Propionispira raffinosivorans]|uniref:EscU/YscU/HrcU family type III secretion system export apparatus switch protein n=1 Tax=Propionispira raffinosivorans TaxID=86959 RepID=UPI00037D783A|nr:EscU/YscU/HrcU family type III secretion system export apparatus switch protein [Propionispira raffinosivorans]